MARPHRGIHAGAQPGLLRRVPAENPGQEPGLALPPLEFESSKLARTARTSVAAARLLQVARCMPDAGWLAWLTCVPRARQRFCFELDGRYCAALEANAARFCRAARPLASPSARRCSIARQWQPQPDPAGWEDLDRGTPRAWRRCLLDRRRRCARWRRRRPVSRLPRPAAPLPVARLRPPPWRPSEIQHNILAKQVSSKATMKRRRPTPPVSETQDPAGMRLAATRRPPGAAGGEAAVCRTARAHRDGCVRRAAANDLAGPG